MRLWGAGFLRDRRACGLWVSGCELVVYVVLGMWANESTYYFGGFCDLRLGCLCWSWLFDLSTLSGFSGGSGVGCGIFAGFSPPDMRPPLTSLIIMSARRAQLRAEALPHTPEVAGLHLKRRKDPHPQRVRVNPKCPVQSLPGRAQSPANLGSVNAAAGCGSLPPSSDF